MTKVDEQVTMDGLRVVETYNDGLNAEGKADGTVMRTESREANLGEQAGALAEDIRRQVQGMVPHANSSVISCVSVGDNDALLKIALSRSGFAKLPDSAPPSPKAERAEKAPSAKKA